MRSAAGPGRLHSMARPVQLAPGSLALVLSRLEVPGAARGAEEPGGRAVFRAFRRANARCFWNSRLARAASRLAFQGWLRRGVLLVHAPPASLQVLRDAWCRRALRPPRGFRIRAVGECGAPEGRGVPRQLRGSSPGHRGACNPRLNSEGAGTGRIEGTRGWEGGLGGSRRAVHPTFPPAGTRTPRPSSCPGPTPGYSHSSTLYPVERTGSWRKELSN